MDELAEHTRNIAVTVLESLATGERPNDAPAKDADTPLRCSVKIEGDWNGAVLVSVSPGLAHWVACRMFGAPSAASESEDTREAVREISNIVAGNIKPLLGPGNTLGLPVDVGRDQPLPTDAMTHVAVDHHGELLQVHLLQAA